MSTRWFQRRAVSNSSALAPATPPSKAPCVVKKKKRAPFPGPPCTARLAAPPPSFILLLRSLQLYNTYLALIITRVAFYLPFSTLMIKSFFDSIPRDLEEAATVDGCSQFGIFLRIILPLVLTGVATIFIFSFLNSWNEFLFSVTVVSKDTLRTITVGLAKTKDQYGIDWGTLMSLSIVSLLPPLIIFMMMQQYFIKGLTAGAVKT